MKNFPAPIDALLRDLPAFDASAVKNRFRQVAAQAAKGAVAISRYGRPEWVILSADDYVRLEKARRAPLGQLPGQFDRQKAKMQARRSRKAVQVLFGASPAALGKAAVKAAHVNAR